MKRSTKERLLGLLIIIPVLILLITSMSSCMQSQGQKEIKVEQAILNNPDAALIYYLPFTPSYGQTAEKAYVIRIDGCQYIVLPGNHEFAIVHKANCYNSIHYDSPSSK